jgi:hypothetical protein
MNEDYFKQQALRVRALADRADPFVKKRLLDLAENYEAKIVGASGELSSVTKAKLTSTSDKLPSVSIGGQHDTDHLGGGDAG